MLDLKCVYCPERGPSSGKCFNSVNKKDESGKLFAPCEEVISECTYVYSNRFSTSNDDLMKENSHA